MPLKCGGVTSQWQRIESRATLRAEVRSACRYTISVQGTGLDVVTDLTHKIITYTVVTSAQCIIIIIIIIIIININAKICDHVSETVSFILTNGPNEPRN
jgi:hypothetical protein